MTHTSKHFSFFEFCNFTESPVSLYMLFLSHSRSSKVSVPQVSMYFLEQATVESTILSFDT